MNFRTNSTESVQEQAQKEENLEDTKNTTDKKTPDGKQGIKDVHEKDIQIKVNTLQLNEENEDCGIFFTLQSATYKKAKYVLTCKIKNSRKGETVDVEKFAKGFSVKLGEAEWNAVLLTGRKTLKYHETTEAKMLVKCKQDVSGDMTNYRLFYTTEPEEDEDQIQQFRTEYIVKSRWGVIRCFCIFGKDYYIKRIFIWHYWLEQCYLCYTLQRMCIHIER